MSSAATSQVFSILALVISALALAISAITAWLTLFRRGTVKMTQPTVIFFGFSEPRSSSERPWPKVFLRTLLFSTAKRGQIIESLYVRLTCEDIVQDFNVWVYGEKNQLVRGSGLFVSETGVEANHHFLISTDSEAFHFVSGTYQVDVYVYLLRAKTPKLLFSYSLEVSEKESDLIGEQDTGLYFDWDPSKRVYIHHLDRRPTSFWQSDRGKD